MLWPAPERGETAREYGNAGKERFQRGFTVAIRAGLIQRQHVLLNTKEF